MQMQSVCKIMATALNVDTAKGRTLERGTPMKYRTKLWTSISAAALIAASSAVSGMASATASHDGAEGAKLGTDAQGTFLMAQAGEGEGEGGEGEGGEGGEGGIDPAAAAKNPALFISALDIIRAHYLAGAAMLDVEGGRRAAGEMFAHPISEVYIDLEPVFEKQGVRPFMDDMTNAVDLALGDAPKEDVMTAVEKVYADLDAAEKKAPKGKFDPRSIDAALMADMFDRAAKQYDAAISPAGTAEAWIDGYGFWKIAERRAGELLPKLDGKHEDMAAEIAAGEELFANAYKSVEKPATPEVEPGALLAASSRILLKTSSF